MQFPLRLSADLLRTNFSGRFVAATPVFRLSPLVTHVSHSSRINRLSPEFEWHSPVECVRLAAGQRARVVWLGDAEPMLHPEIGSVASALVASGRHVLLHTSGQGLRKRIHELAPVSRLFLAIEFAVPELAHDRFASWPRAFRLAIEAVRAAKLSGFLVCAHVTVTPAGVPLEVSKLFEILDARDVDGFVVSSGGNHPTRFERGAYQTKLEEARNLIHSRFWRRFSQLLEASYADFAPAAVAYSPAREREADACGESA